MSTGPTTGLETSLDRSSQLFLTDEVSASEARPGMHVQPSEAVIDHYRCPQDLIDVVSNEPLSSSAGFFRFGQNGICYGRSREAVFSARPDSKLDDVASEVAVENERLLLPFNLKEVIDNLRLERYRNGEAGESTFFRLCKKLYYHLRPFTNQMVRKQVQKFHARNWKKRLFPQWPIDTTVENLFERVLLLSMKARGLEKIPFVWFWPNGARGCLTMTHDVETKAGRDFCPTLMDVDEAFGIKAAFGIVPEERYEVPSDLLASMRSRGFEVIIQDLNHDGRLFDEKEEFLRRAKIINRHAREYGAEGFRAAILYRKPEWYEALDFAFDTSFPNVAPLDPQQGGCCTVMPFFIGEMLEIPITAVQDYTLFHVLNERSIDLWKAQTDMVLKKNGLLSFIVHPDYVLQPDTLSVYKHLLGYLKGLRDKTSIWCALPSEINAWWRARNKMSVVKDGDSWRIVGEGCERAVLAYAKNVEGKLIYEFSQPMQAQ
jgi:hypothetical protein